ncbi:MAG: flagellar protein [Lachnospiraceae bacterium]|nr:flagellar protein [Lachnospiraceae bacterium]
MQTQTMACTRCRRLFNYIGGERLCPSCKEESEKEFQRVRDYIWDHKGCNLVEVSEFCEVSEKQIKEWIRSERLEFYSPAGDIVCEKCGTPIISGRFCDKCRSEMVGELKSAIKKDAPAPPVKKNNSDHKDRMRFL